MMAAMRPFLPRMVVNLASDSSAKYLDQFSTEPCFICTELNLEIYHFELFYLYQIWFEPSFDWTEFHREQGLSIPSFI